jgi:hypothetical protein
VKRSGRPPRVGTDRAGTAVVSQAGAVPLVETTAGVDAARSEAVPAARAPQAASSARCLLTFSRSCPVSRPISVTLTLPDARREVP